MSSLIKFTLIILGLHTLFSACSNKIPDDFDYGKIENHSYQNNYLNFKIDLLPDWYVLNQEESKAMQEEGVEFLAGDDEVFKKQLEKSTEIKVANLMTVMKYTPEEQPVGLFNPSLDLVAENMATTPQLGAKEYLDIGIKMLKKSQAEFSFEGEYRKVKLDGKTFLKASGLYTTPEITLHQDLMAIKVRTFILLITSSYIDEEQKASLDEMIASFRFL